MPNENEFQRGDTHRYSQSKGIPRLRKAICDWFQRRYDMLICDVRVAVAPGIGFGHYGDDSVRFGLIENEHRTRQMFRNDGLMD